MKIEITYDSGLKRTYETRQEPDPHGDNDEYPVWEFTTKDPASGDELITARILRPKEY